MSLPPGAKGAPYVGETAALFRHTYTYGAAHTQRYGAIWSTRYLGGIPGVVLASAEGQKLVLADEPHKFSWNIGYGLGEDVFWGNLFMMDGVRHDQQRHLMTPAFAGAAYARYLADMNQVVASQLDTWGNAGTIAWYPQAKTVAFALASTLLAGITLPEMDRQRYQRDFAQLLAGASDFLRQGWLFWTKYAQAARARRRIDTWLGNLIAARQANPGEDALGLLIAARDEQGQALTPRDLVGMAVTIIFAGSDSTASAISFLLVELLQQPALYDEVRALVGTGTEPVTQDDFRALPMLDALIEETLRLHPATPVIMRGATDPFEFGGYAIPAGTRVFLIPGYTQRHPQYFPEPDRYRPQRFLQHESMPPYAHIPFGGGKRNCIGSGVAKLELKTLIMHLLRRFDLTLVPGQNLTPLGLPQNRPHDDVLLTYKRRSATSR